MGEIFLNQIPDSFISQIADRLHIHSTILLKLYFDERGNKQAMHIGSGTFVIIKGIHGILTAQHVTRTLSGDYSLGLTVTREDEEQEFKVDKSSIKIIDVGTSVTEEYGPDLSFIILADWDKIGTIKVSKSFHDLSRDQEELLTNPPATDFGIWFVCGAPGERTRIEQSRSSFGEIFAFQDYCAAGGVQREYERGNYDYFEMDIDVVSEADIPHNFAGMSGGGLWQVTVARAEDQTLIPKRYLFSGVVFYQGVGLSR